MSSNPRKGPSGRKISVTAPTGGLASGALFAIVAGIQGWVGEVIATIAAGVEGAVEVGHQATIPKNTGTGMSFAKGDLWYLDASTGKATPTATGNTLGGKVLAVASTSATTVEVMFFPVGGLGPSIAGLGSTFVPFVPAAAQQALSGAGAVNVTSYCTKWTTPTGGAAGTLANGVQVGQLKKVQLIVDGGDGVLTPANLAAGTTITFADVGDFALLLWNGTDWVAIELGNDADGATAPVLA